MDGFQFRGTLTNREMRDRIAVLSTIGDRQLLAEWRKVMGERVVDPMARELGHLAPAGQKGDSAARSIVGVRGQYPAIKAGVARSGSWAGDHGRPWVPFFALEFGMNRGAYTTYLRRRKRGGGQVVTRRRVRTWALPARRSNGYWFAPGFKRLQPKYRDIVVAEVDEFVRNRIGG